MGNTVLTGLIDWAVARMRRLWSSHGGPLGFALLALYVTTVVAVAAAYPSPNWDMVAYVAAALDNGAYSAAELHKAAWHAVRERVSEGEFLVLTADRPYRIRQYTDAGAFSTMLGFYKAKFLYVELASWLARWMQPVDGLRLISTASAAVFGGVVILWASKEKLLALAPFILALLMFSGFAHSAFLTVPDLFAAVFLILGVWLYLLRLDIASIAMLVLAFLVRPDHLVFIAVFAMAALAARQGYVAALGALALALATYLPIAQAAGHPGWWTQMWFTNVEYVPTLKGFAPEFSILAYLKILLRVAVRSLAEESWPALLLLQLMALGAFVSYKVPMRDRERVLLCALVLTIGAKFLVAPFHEARLHTAYLVALGMILLGIWGRSATVRGRLGGSDTQTALDNS